MLDMRYRISNSIPAWRGEGAFFVSAAIVAPPGLFSLLDGVVRVR